jgi:hypothetical protein
MVNAQRTKWVLRIWLIVGIPFSLYILLRRPVTSANSKSINGHFKSILADTLKGDVSYDVYIKEDPDVFKISADWSKCFEDVGFEQDVKVGQPIQIFVKQGPEFSSARLLVGIKANGLDYLSAACINDDLRNEKIHIPLFFGIGAVLIGAVSFLKRKSNV